MLSGLNLLGLNICSQVLHAHETIHGCKRDLNIYMRTLCTVDAINFKSINEENIFF